MGFVKTNREFHATLAMARDLVQSRGVNNVVRIDAPARLTITLTKRGDLHGLTIVRHSDDNRVVLSALWRDNSPLPAEILEWHPGAWLWILKRAANLKPVSILP